MTRILIAGGAAVVFAIAGYFAGAALRPWPKWYRPAFFGILVLGAGVLALALVGKIPVLAAITVGATFGLLNGVRYGFTQPFAGLSGGGHAEDREL